MILSVLCAALSFAFIKIAKRTASDGKEKSSVSSASIDIEIEEEENYSYVTRKYLRAPKKLRNENKAEKESKRLAKNPKRKVKVRKRPALFTSDIEDDDIEDENRV